MLLELFPYWKLKAKPIKFASYHPLPSPQTSSPSVFHFSEWCNHSAADLIWPLRNTPDSCLSLMPNMQLLSASGPSYFSLIFSTLSFSLLPNQPPHLHLIPHLWSLSPQCCWVTENVTQSFSSLKCFRGSPSSPRYRANLLAQNLRSSPLLTFLIYLPWGSYTYSSVQLYSTICYFLRSSFLSLWNILSLCPPFLFFLPPSFSLFLSSSLSIMELILCQ